MLNDELINVYLRSLQIRPETIRDRIFFMRSSFIAQIMDFGRRGRINSATHHAVETHVKH